MQLTIFTAEAHLAGMTRSVMLGEQRLDAGLEAIPAPAYITDEEGYVTFFNRMCPPFTGRSPEAMADRWCVTWKLYGLDGLRLPHHECPMAVAVRERRKIRDIEAIAERPDGKRLLFAPFPTPLFDASGQFRGAVNLLLDVSHPRHVISMYDEARRARRLSAQTGDTRTAQRLCELAAHHEERGRRLDRARSLLTS